MKVEYKNFILQLVADDYLEKAIRLALADEPESKNLIALLARQNALLRESLKGTESYAELTRLHNQIRRDFLDAICVETMPEIKPSGLIEEPFWVISQTEARAKKLLSYFKSLRFSKAVGKVLTDFEAPSPEIRLIVFDAIRIEKPDLASDLDESAFLLLLRQYLEKGYPVVFYGQYYKELEKYRANAHASNSQFSLFARVQEMLEYLDRYRMPE